MNLCSLKSISYCKVSEYNFLFLRYSDHRIRICYTCDSSFDWSITEVSNTINIVSALKRTFGPFNDPSHFFFWLYAKIVINKNLQVLKSTDDNVKKFNLSKILKENIFYIDSKPLTSKFHAI